MHALHVGGCACSNWNYETYDPKDKIVKARCLEVLVGLRRGTLAPSAAADTRPTHQKMFKGLTHPDCPYFAGHYRGSRDCLIGYDVDVGTATTESADRVDKAMAAFAQQVQADLAAVQAPTTLAPADALVGRLDVVLDRMVEFLTIHPYANGNGHMQRFIVWCFFAAMNFWPKKWPMDIRPPRPYDDYIAAYRIGEKDPLRHYMLTLVTRA